MLGWLDARSSVGGIHDHRQRSGAIGMDGCDVHYVRRRRGEGSEGQPHRTESARHGQCNCCSPHDRKYRTLTGRWGEPSEIGSVLKGSSQRLVDQFMLIRREVGDDETVF